MATETQDAGTDVKAADAPAGEVQGPRRYIYCIIDGDDGGAFGPIGIDGGSEVFAVGFDGTAAVVSATSKEKQDISRTTAIAHQRVMEAVMQRGHTVLPVRFNTVAEPKAGKTVSRRIIDHVLVARREEIRSLLSKMHSVVELGVKGLWRGMPELFQSIAEGSREIQALRGKLQGPAGHGGAPARAAHGRPADMTAWIRLGELVKKALEARKADMEAALLKSLSPLAVDVRKNKTFGDSMFANVAILVEKPRQEAVAAALSAFEAAGAGRMQLRCVGPLPPSNFLELVITWDD